MNIAKHGWWWLLGGVNNNFSSYTLSPDNPVILAGGDDALRDQSICELDEDTWVCAYAVGETNARLGIKYATSPKSDPHNWTKVDSFLIESEPLEWDTDIEGGDIIKLEDGSWVIAYADEQTGKVGIATRAAGTFGAFTKSASNPVIDNTANTTAWNRYIRHVSIIKEGSTYYMFYEARTHPLGNSPSQSKIGRATSTDLVTWTLDADPLIEKADFSGNFLAYNTFWMPNIYKIDGVFYLIMMAVVGSGVGVNRSNQNGWIVARSNDLVTFTMLNTEKPLVPIIGVNGGWETRVREEPVFFVENGNIHVYYNNTTIADGEFKIGYATLSKGSFNDSLPAALVQDSFDDDSIDTNKWLATNVGGITVTEQERILNIEADGTTQALTDVFEDIVGFTDQVNDVAQWALAFDYFRSTNSGGDLEIGISNAAGTNKVVFRKGTALTNIRMTITLGGVVIYNQESAYQAGGLKIVRDGSLMSFWNLQNGEWANITVSGDSPFGTIYVDVTDWASEQVYIKVMAQNDTTPYVVRLNDIKLTGYNSPVPSTYELTDNSDADNAVIRLYDIDSQELAAIRSFVESCKTNGNWDLLDEVFVFKNNSTAAPIGLKRVISTVTGATHGADGYDFDGTDDFISSNLNLVGLKNYSLNNALVSVYVHTVGDQSVVRGLFDSLNGSAATRIFSQTGNINFRINNNTVRVVAGAFASDKLYTFVRTSSLAADMNLYTDGVVQSSSGGSVSNSIPNDVVEIGRLVTPGNYFDGIIGLVAVGAAIGFDHAAWNTDVRQLISDLT